MVKVNKDTSILQGKMLYLAQKYTDVEKAAYMTAVSICRYMLNSGYDSFFSPILHSHPLAMNLEKYNIKISYSTYLKQDLGILKNFKPDNLVMLILDNSVLVLNNEIRWQSKGVKAEYEWAKANNVKCYLVSPCRHVMPNDPYLIKHLVLCDMDELFQEKGGLIVI